MSTNEHPQAEYRRLGKSGLRVSVPILGAMSFGSDKWSPWVLNEDKVRPTIITQCFVAQWLVLK
jgi:aryl-alcohol dehydrogenase-like predicted oxidoreductase